MVFQQANTWKLVTFNWLTLTSEMHFVKFHPEVASCLLSRGKRKYAPLGMRLIWKYIWNYFLVYQLILHFLSYLQNYKEFKAKIWDLQPKKYGLSFDIKKCTTSGWALGDENVISIRAFNCFHLDYPTQRIFETSWTLHDYTAHFKVSFPKYPSQILLVGTNSTFNTQQDYYGWRCGTLLHSYCTGTYTEVTVLLLWGNSAVTMEYPHSYSVGVPAWLLQGSLGATSKK